MSQDIHLRLRLNVRVFQLRMIHIRFRQITRRDRLCKGDLNDPLYQKFVLIGF